MRPPGVAPSDAGGPGSGEARLLASGALVQQIAQGAGLLVLLVIVTVLARRSVASLPYVPGDATPLVLFPRTSRLTTRSTCCWQRPTCLGASARFAFVSTAPTARSGTSGYSISWRFRRPAMDWFAQRSSCADRRRAQVLVVADGRRERVPGVASDVRSSENWSRAGEQVAAQQPDEGLTDGGAS